MGDVLGVPRGNSGCGLARCFGGPPGSRLVASSEVGSELALAVNVRGIDRICRLRGRGSRLGCQQPVVVRVVDEHRRNHLERVSTVSGKSICAGHRPGERENVTASLDHDTQGHM